MSKQAVMTFIAIWMTGVMVSVMACGIGIAMSVILKRLFLRTFDIILGLTVAWLVVGFGVLMIMLISNPSWW